METKTDYKRAQFRALSWLYGGPCTRYTPPDGDWMREWRKLDQLSRLAIEYAARFLTPQTSLVQAMSRAAASVLGSTPSPQSVMGRLLRLLDMARDDTELGEAMEEMWLRAGSREARHAGH